ncbi:hypothetical protein BRARA_F01749 [Brassica rapa]|uniref:Uncharacterized protein n=1 Tax=Brassica campestris TaxID=3711 RepID=A0A397Z5J2_BRACM|nr:hypothetical protein BRARA_F01749 [Brassica rapa]
MVEALQWVHVTFDVVWSALCPSGFGWCGGSGFSPPVYIHLLVALKSCSFLFMPWSSLLLYVDW